ncbi:MAG: hypothetical protein ACYCVH_16770 [Ignavibacteriaceae bacterium]
MLKKRNSVIATNTIVLAIILLAGIIMMIYGYIHNNSFIIYVGVFIIGATSFIVIIFQTIFPQKIRRRIFMIKRPIDIRGEKHI